MQVEIRAEPYPASCKKGEMFMTLARAYYIGNEAQRLQQQQVFLPHGVYNT